MSIPEVDEALPLVSVVTVCYNLISADRKYTFVQCVASVQSQTYSRIEHLVIDGGSTDGTLELLEEYQAKGWIRFISEPDKGIYDAMNKGIRAAAGKYVVFLNSDDFWHGCSGVADSVAALESSGAGFSYASRNVVHQNGKLKHVEQASIGVFAIMMPFCHQTMFTRRDVLLKHGGFDDATFRSAADYDLILRILLDGVSCIYVPTNFTSFRLNGFSCTEEGSEESANEVDLCRRRILGDAAADMLRRGYMDENLFLSLCSKVAPVVAQDMLRCFVSHEPGMLQLRTGLTVTLPTGINLPTYCAREVYSYKLFGILPLLTRKVRTNRVDWSLFGFFPLLRWKRGKKGAAWLLFHCIPLLGVKRT